MLETNRDVPSWIQVSGTRLYEPVLTQMLSDPLIWIQTRPEFKPSPIMYTHLTPDFFRLGPSGIQGAISSVKETEREERPMESENGLLRSDCWTDRGNLKIGMRTNLFHP